MPALPARATAVVAPLPEKNYGSLRGGRWPFLYDNVYGLPVVRQVRRKGKANGEGGLGGVRVCVSRANCTGVGGYAVAPNAQWNRQRQRQDVRRDVT